MTPNEESINKEPNTKKPWRQRKVTPSIYVPNKDLGVSEWIPHWDRETINILTNNWYNFQIHHNPNSEHPDFSYGFAPIIPEESFKQQMKTIRRRKQNKVPMFISCKKVTIYPDIDQHNILQTWFNAFAHMFNLTINYLRSKIDKKNIDFNECSKIVDFQSIRTIMYPYKLIIQYDMPSNKIPIHILDEAINQAVSNYKTCLTNLKSGYIKKFRIREWSKNRRRKIIKIESNFFRNDTFCTKIFPQMSASESLEGIDSTVTLQYNSDTKNYILFVPVRTEPKPIFKYNVSCGIDLGVREFVSVYSQNAVLAICSNSSNNRKIKNCHKKIDKIHELLKIKPDNKIQIVETIVKQNGRLEKDLKVKTINRSGLKRGLRKYHKKIT